MGWRVASLRHGSIDGGATIKWQISDFRFQISDNSRKTCEYLLVVAAAVFVFVTLTSGVQFLRYTLPVLPFVLIWSSQLVRDDLWRAAWLRRAVIGGALWSGVSSLAIFPHSVSYFNELAGGPSHGYRHLIDDSFDWGQDLLLLRRWLDAHPEARPLKLAYWGWTDPRSAGIEFELPPRRSELIRVEPSSTEHDASAPTLEPIGLTPGWYAVSVGLSHGGPWIRIHDGAGHEAVLGVDDFAYFRELAPVATAGYSIRIFHLSESLAEQVSDSLKTR